MAEQKDPCDKAITLAEIPEDVGSFGGALESGSHRKQLIPEGRKFFAHESSYVDEPCEIGEGTKIWHFCHIMSGAKIGRQCNIGQNVVISPQVTLGDNVKVQNNVSVYTGVILEDDVFCGPSIVFTNVINPRSHVSRRSEYRTTLVKKGASIGANATVICGVTIGRYAFVGAGSVVTREVPDYALVVGSPARWKAWMCQCGIKLPLNVPSELHQSAICAACGRRYGQSGVGIFEIGHVT